LAANKIAPATFNLERRTLHAVFNVARKWGYININPFTTVTRAKPQEKRLFMTEGEIGILLDGIGSAIRDALRRVDASTYSLFGLFAEFLLNTGLRRNEALTLKPQHVDLAKGVLYIEKTKDKKIRVVPLNGRSKEIVKSLGDELFSKLTTTQVTHIFARLSQRAGLTGFKLHSLRHTFASVLVARGVDLYTVSKLLGHTDLKTTMVYAKVGMELMQNAVDRIQIRTDGNPDRLLPEAAAKGQNESGLMD
jgi:integrase